MHTSTFLSLLLATVVTALPSPFSVAVDKKAPTAILDKRQNASLPSATAQLCTGTDFSGECTNATWPVNQCIDLRGYAGNTLSFLPTDGFECLLMQEKCDATLPYTEVGDSDKETGSDLTTYTWIKDLKSYMCFTELAELRRFVRIARLRVANAESA